MKLQDFEALLRSDKEALVLKIAILEAALSHYSDPSVWCAQPVAMSDGGSGEAWIPCCGHCYMYKSEGRSVAISALQAAGLATTEALAIRPKPEPDLCSSCNQAMIDDAVRTKRGFMHEACAEEAEAAGLFKIDHGDSVYPA